MRIDRKSTGKEKRKHQASRDPVISTLRSLDKDGLDAWVEAEVNSVADVKKLLKSILLEVL